MKNLMTKIGYETVFGGLFGIVAIIAIIAEMAIGGFDSASVAGGIKDIASTIVIVMVFIVGIKNVLKNYPKNFTERLTSAMNEWIDENSNMIIRNPKYDEEHKGQGATCYSLDLKTEVSDFYRPIGTTKNTGLFLRMPTLNEENYSKGNVEIRFYLNKGTFFSDKPKDIDLSADYQYLIELFTKLVNDKYSGFAKADGKQQMITVCIDKPIVTNEDIDNMIDVINTMYTSYLVSANLKKW